MSPNTEIKTGDEVLDNKILEWANWNKNDLMWREAEALIKNGKKEELEEVFMRRLTFGTAGLRGAMGPGYSRMNHLVVIQTAQGLLSYLTKVQPQVIQRGVVIGYDGRHNSLEFAKLSAVVFVRRGIPVKLFSKMCPTPFVPFTVSHYGASAGVMVTASHNPKQDNGYKVYWSNGAQIIPPVDKGIASSITECLEPWEGVWDTDCLSDNPLVVDPLEEICAAYTSYIKSRLYDSEANADAPFNITYTPMHGVGYPYIRQVFQAAGFKEVIGVKEQLEPDGDFPTVEFPNPEEGKSALVLSIKTANETGCPLILANDPDADRLAVAEKTSEGDWKVFSGNELGALLAWWEMMTYKASQAPNTNFSDAYMMSSTVSSKIVKSICDKEGLSFEETLTGFKWMGNRGEELIKQGKTVLFAFEEAIGFMCSSVVLDKDGVSAAVRVAELATHLYNKGENLQSQLANIYSKYGHHVSKNSYFICHRPEVIKKIFERLRTFKGEANTYHTEVGEWSIRDVRDLTTGYDSTQPEHKATLPTSSSSQMITYQFENGLVATLRTSGTEPKIKYYTEMCAPPHIKDVVEIKKDLDGMVEAIIEEMLQPAENGLKYRQAE